MRTRKRSREGAAPPLIGAGVALHADAVAVEAIEALAGEGVVTILLRGPVIARHFYGHHEVRTYGDADLLIEAEQRPAAEAVARRLGYVHRAVLGQRSSDRPPWSSTWVRPQDGAELDLHWSLVGARADPSAIWAALLSEREIVRLLGRDVHGLTAAAAALIVSLHAAHHGSRVSHPLADLKRALALSLEEWEHARDVAERIIAKDAMSAGLRLLPAGVSLADRLGLSPTHDVETLLRVETAPPMALGFEWLSRTPGLRQKFVLIAGKLVPDRAFMQAWFPPARGGTPLGLALGYVWRPVWLLLHSVAGLRAWRQARRTSRDKA